MYEKGTQDDMLVVSYDRQKEKNYWLNILSGDFEKSSFPVDDVDDGHYDLKNPELLRNNVELRLRGELFDKLIKLSNKSDIRLHMILVAGLVVLLYKYTGKNDIVVGAPVLKQEAEENFINTKLIIRSQIEEGMTFRELLLQIRQTIIKATENVNYPVRMLPLQLKMSSSENDFPLFDIAILLENIHHRKYCQDIPINFIFSFLRMPGFIQGVVEYNSCLYKKSTVERITSHYVHLLLAVLSDVTIPLGKIDILLEEEKSRLLKDFNNTDTNFPRDQMIHHLFEDQVEKVPDKVALVFGNQVLTYKKLNATSNQLARSLNRKGVKSGTIVAILIDNSIEMIAAILGILKAGGSFLPLDPEYPEDRIAYMLKDAGGRLLLSTLSTIKKFPFTNLQGLSGSDSKVSPVSLKTRPQITDLDRLPFPDRSLVDYEKYNNYIGQSMVKNSMSVQATRGCPFNCAYCHKIWPKRHVVRSAEHILEEIKIFYNMGVRRFSFVDDIFNLNIENSKRFFQSIIDKRMNIHLFFPNGMRGDLLTREYIDLMMEAGVVNVTLALETASSRLQKLINKNLNLEKLEENLRYICKNYPHIILELQTMHGFPTETEEEAMKTLDFIKRQHWVDFPYINILKIYPKSDMMRLALKNGVPLENILRSEHLAHHELPATLPFDKSFTLKYQTNFLNEYFLLKERMLHKLPFQMKLLTEDEMVQKYDSYLPVDINCLEDILQLAGIKREELPAEECLAEDIISIPDLNKQISKHYFQVQTIPQPGALKLLLIDLSQYFTSDSRMLYDVVEPPLGLMYIMTYLKQQFGEKISGKICKSRIDFDSYHELKELLENYNPDIIGVRTLIFHKNFFHKTIALIRQWGIDKPIIAGGPYATSSYQTILQDKNIDLVVVGEGENTVAEIIEKTIQNGGRLPSMEILNEIPGVAVRQEAGAENAVSHPVSREIIFIDELEYLLSKEPDQNIILKHRPEDLAYIIYTSGSTGNPKGVMIEHQGVVNYLCWAVRNYTKGERINFPLFTSIAFDLTITSIFTPLIAGNAVIIVAGEDKRLLIDTVMEENSVEIVKVTPTHLKLLRNKRFKNSAIKRLIIGGENLETQLANDIFEHFKRRIEIYNEYGPTETVVGCMLHRFDPDKDKGRSVPIGTPADNANVYILDNNLRPLPIAAPGELYISGVGVARGYLNKVERSYEQFFDDPFVPESRIYRTGDLARWTSAGIIEFLGRVDNQVKVNGFRVELGEIENRLMKHRDIAEAVVTVRPDRENGDECICAYWIPGSGRDDLKVSDLREYLSHDLPYYMIPAYFVRLDSIPLTANGKLDRKALPAPQLTTTLDEYLAPRNEVEENFSDTWQQILRVERISINDNFFELGGDSLKAIKVVSRLENRGIHVTVDKLFKHQTIRRICDQLLLEDKAHESVKKSFKPGPAHALGLKATFTGENKEEMVHELDKNNRLTFLLKTNKIAKKYPISPAQQAFFLMPRRLVSARVILFSSDLPNLVDQTQMKQILGKLISEHSLMRSVIEREDRNYSILEFESFPNIDIPFLDISSYTPACQEQILAVINQHLIRPFELFDHLLYRMCMLRLDNKRVRLIFAFNHLIFDRHSAVLLEDRLKGIGEEMRFDRDATEQDKLAGEATKNDYYEYVRFLARLDYQEIELANFIDFDSFAKYNARILKGSKVGEFACDSFEVDLKQLTPALRDYYNELIIICFAYFIKDLHSIDKVPLFLVSNGRYYNDANFSHVLGDLHDIIPVLLSLEKNQLPHAIMEQFIDYREYIKSHNLNFANYFSKNPDILKKHAPHFSSPFIFNPVIGAYDYLKDKNFIRHVKESLKDLPKTPYFELYMSKDLHSSRVFILYIQNFTLDHEEIHRRFIKNYNHLVQRLFADQDLSQV